MQGGGPRLGPGTPIDRLRSRRMTADDATAGPSSAPLAAPSPVKPTSPTKAGGPRDKENTPAAVANSMQGSAAGLQRVGGHARTPSGHDAMTRDMGNLQMAPSSRHELLPCTAQQALAVEQQLFVLLLCSICILGLMPGCLTCLLAHCPRHTLVVLAACHSSCSKSFAGWQLLQSLLMR